MYVSLGAGRYVPGSTSLSNTAPAADPFTGNIILIIFTVFCLASVRLEFVWLLSPCFFLSSTWGSTVGQLIDCVEPVQLCLAQEKALCLSGLPCITLSSATKQSDIKCHVLPIL